MGDRIHRSHEGAAWSVPAQPRLPSLVTKIFERLKQLVCAAISFLAIFAQRFADNLLKLSGRVRRNA